MSFRLNADKASKNVIFSLQIFGLWKPQPRTKAYNIYSTVYFIICPRLLNILMFIFLLNSGDQKDLTSTLYMLLTQLCGGIKSSWFLMRNHEFQQLVQRSKSFTLHTTEIMAFEFKTKITIWYPFLDWRNFVRDYWIAVSFAHIAIISASFLIITVDNSLCVLLFIVSIELKSIGKRFSTLGYPEKEKETPKKRLDRINVEIEYFKVMKSCINCHYEALNFKCSLETRFSLPFYFQIVFRGIIIAFIINEMAKVRIVLFLILIIKIKKK